MKILWILFFSIGAANAGGLFVGNAGDGIAIGDRVISRDLFMRGVQDSPYIGKDLDPALLPLAPIFSFSIPEDLLARKLTDINQVAPGLGDFLKLSFQRYSWTLVESPLTPIENPNDTIQLPQGASMVQLANRLMMTVRIQRDGWDRLDDSNKVALLIHEAVYSLVLPQKTGESFAQSARVAQEVTGAFFDADYYRIPSSIAYGYLSRILAIPGGAVTLDDIRRPASWQLIYGKVSKECGGPCPADIRRVSFDFSKGATPKQLRDFLANACAEAQNASQQDGNTEIISVFKPKAVTANIAFYETSDPTLPTQNYIAIAKQVVESNLKTYSFESGLPAKWWASNLSCVDAFEADLFGATQDLN